MGSETFPKIPIIDFNHENLNPNSSSWSSTSENVKNALEEYGCFVVLYDKISSKLQNEIFDAEKELFDLPLEIKVKNVTDIPYHGYVGQFPFMPLHESSGITNSTTLEGTQSFTNLMWDNGNDHFRKTVHTYSKQVAAIDQMVQQMVFESYGVEKYFKSHSESTYYLLRLMKYRAPEMDENNEGFRAHTDKSFSAILQQSQVKGLEVETKDGHWIPIDPLPSSFVFVAGDVFKGWSNGRIRSPRHRVIMGKEERYSVGLFSFSNGTIQIPEELCDEDHPLQFKSFSHNELLHFFNTDQGRKAECVVKAFCGIEQVVVT